MDLIQEEADRLLAVSKFVYTDTGFEHTYVIDIEKDEDIRLLLSSADNESTFLFRIQRSKKNAIKLTLHHQDNETRFCLLRVDYNGGSHTNPMFVSERVPHKFIPYAGRILTCNHIHYHVEGYKTAAWAIPLKTDGFNIKNITENDFNTTFVKAIECFSKLINLETRIIVSGHYGKIL